MENAQPLLYHIWDSSRVVHLSGYQEQPKTNQLL